MKKIIVKSSLFFLLLLFSLTGCTADTGNTVGNVSGDDSAANKRELLNEKLKGSAEKGKKKLEELQDRIQNGTYYTVIRISSRITITSVLASEPEFTKVQIDGSDVSFSHPNSDEYTYDPTDIEIRCKLPQGKHTLAVWSNCADDAVKAEINIDRQELRNPDNAIVYGTSLNHPAYFAFEYILGSFGKKVKLKDLGGFHGYDVEDTDEEYVEEDTGEDTDDEEDDYDYDYEEDASGDYILPDSDSRKLKKSDLKGLSKKELRLARNEIYARHGRLFQDEELQEYFDSKDWYDGYIDPEDFIDSEYLSSIERRNAKFIKKFE